MNAPFQLKPNINYCVTVDGANRAIDEVLRDAQGGAVAVDIETAPIPEEVSRLDTLRRRLAVAKGEHAALRQERPPPRSPPRRPRLPRWPHRPPMQTVPL